MGSKMMERNEAKVSMAETLKIFGEWSVVKMEGLMVLQPSNFDSKMGGGVTEFVHKSIGKCMGSLTKPPVASLFFRRFWTTDGPRFRKSTSEIPHCTWDPKEFLQGLTLVSTWICVIVGSKILPISEPNMQWETPQAETSKGYPWGWADSTHPSMSQVEQQYNRAKEV